MAFRCALTSRLSGGRSRPSVAADCWAFRPCGSFTVNAITRLTNALIRLDARLLDHLGPLRDLGLDDRAELIRKVANCFPAKIGEFGAQVRERERLYGFVMEPAHDRCRGLCRRE